MGQQLYVAAGWFLNVQGSLQTAARMGFMVNRLEGRLNARVSKSFLKDGALTLSLTADDILRTGYYHFNVYGIGSYNGNRIYRDWQRVGIQLSYKFNATKSKYKGTGAGQSEKGPSVGLHRFCLFSADDLLEVCIDPGVPVEIPEREAAQLIVVVPVIEQFVDVFLAGFVLADLGVVQVEGADLSHHEGFDIGVIAFAGNPVGFSGNLQLAFLVVELFGQDEEVLVEVHGFLAQLAFSHLTVAFGHTDLSAPFSPVEQGDSDSDFHHLIVFQVLVGGTEAVVGARISHLGEQGDFPEISPGFGHFVVASSWRRRMLRAKELLARAFSSTS